MAGCKFQGWRELVMRIWKEMEQRSEEWFRARAGRITASNLKKILTPTGAMSKQSEDYVYELCASCVRPDEVVFEGNLHTDRGNALEPVARELFVERTGFDVRQVGFVTHDDSPVLGCSPDGLVYRDGVPVAGLEIKCPLGKNHARYLYEGVLPSEYKAQVHGSMVVTGLDSWWFMSFNPGFEPFVIEVKRDGYTDKLGDAMVSFAKDYLAKMKVIIPVITGKEGGVK
ncbi:MAG: YqaJ viral recombinase family protein [Akkermansia sp.]